MISSCLQQSVCSKVRRMAWRPSVSCKASLPRSSARAVACSWNQTYKKWGCASPVLFTVSNFPGSFNLSYCRQHHWILKYCDFITDSIPRKENSRYTFAGLLPENRIAEQTARFPIGFLWRTGWLHQVLTWELGHVMSAQIIVPTKVSLAVHCDMPQMEHLSKVLSGSTQKSGTLFRRTFRPLTARWMHQF